MNSPLPIIAFLSLALVAALPDRAAADDLPPASPALVFPAADAQPAAATPRARPNWRTYGGPILLMDAVTVASLAVPLAMGPSVTDHPVLAVPTTLGFVGLLSYPVRGPLIHLGHGNSGDALRSLGVRFGAPVSGFYAGLILGALYTEEFHESTSLETVLQGAAWGTLGGMMAGGIIDSWVLARRPRPVLGSEPGSGGVAIAPIADLREDGFQLGLRGRF
jgi:hypothetical protein